MSFKVDLCGHDCTIRCPAGCPCRFCGCIGTQTGCSGCYSQSLPVGAMGSILGHHSLNLGLYCPGLERVGDSAIFRFQHCHRDRNGDLFFVELFNVVDMS